MGKSGINFLVAAYKTFIEEIKIFEKQVKDFPDRESSIKAKKHIKQLKWITKNLEDFIKKSEKMLKF